MSWDVDITSKKFYLSKHQTHRYIELTILHVPSKASFKCCCENYHLLTRSLGSILKRKDLERNRHKAKNATTRSFWPSLPPLNKCFYDPGGNEARGTSRYRRNELITGNCRKQSRVHCQKRNVHTENLKATLKVDCKRVRTHGCEHLKKHRRWNEFRQKNSLNCALALLTSTRYVSGRIWSATSQLEPTQTLSNEKQKHAVWIIQRR